MRTTARQTRENPSAAMSSVAAASTPCWIEPGRAFWLAVFQERIKLLTSCQVSWKKSQGISS